MDIDSGLDFARANHRGVIATTRADGTTQMSPIVAGVDAQGRVVVSSRETAYKVGHVRAMPYAGICLFTDAFFGDWVQLEGPVDVVSLPEAMEPLIDYYRSLSGEHPDWDEYRAAMERERRVILRMTVERAGPTVAG